MRKKPKQLKEFLEKEKIKNKYEEKIKKINEAYDILSDSEKRKKY